MSRKLSKEDVQALLERYLAGECTLREIEIINRWYQSFEDSDADRILSSEVRAHLKNEMHKNIRSRAAGLARSGRPRAGVGRRDRQVGFGTLWKVAAMLLMGAAVGWYVYSRTADPSMRAVELGAVSDGGAAHADKLAESNASVIYLSDGSVVWLKGGSRLEYPETFEGAEREVVLSGEAFFDVARNEEKPFIIHSLNFKTRVLGTSFNIKDYGNDDAHEVVVVTGKVVVSLKEQRKGQVNELVLQPNKKAVYSSRNGTLMETKVDDAALGTVAQEKLDFQETRLEDIVNVLNRTYAVRIRLAHEGMKGCIITANLTGLDLHVCLETLSKAIGGTYALDDDNIVITSKGCTVEP